MSKKAKDVAADSEELEPVAQPVAAQEKLITFDMFCSLKGIPERRRAGMKAFTGMKRATIAEWETIFSRY